MQAAQHAIPLTGPQVKREGEKHHAMSSVNNSVTVKGELECTSPVTRLFAISEGLLGRHWVAQSGGVLGVALAVNEHQRIPLVVLNDVGDAAEILKPKNKTSDEVRKV